MKLGILVNSDRNLEDIVGITKAAVAKQHEVSIFAMDTGTRLLENCDFTLLNDLEGVRISFCDHSTTVNNVSKARLSENIVKGTQFHNAMMNHDSDRLIVL